MTTVKIFYLKLKLFFSGFRPMKANKEKGFIYEIEDDGFDDLPTKEQAKHLQKSWNRYIKNG